VEGGLISLAILILFFSVVLARDLAILKRTLKSNHGRNRRYVMSSWRTAPRKIESLKRSFTHCPKRCYPAAQ
jgi:hypothetical protein